MTSFCIRSIPNSGRYVPTLVVAQGCGKRFNSRHVKPAAAAATSSTFLNEFLGFNVSLSSPYSVKEDYKLANVFIESLNINYPKKQMVKVSCVLKCKDTDKTSNENKINQISARENYDFLPQDLSRIYYTDSVVDQLFLSNPRLSGIKLPMTTGENSLIFKNHRTNFTTVGVSTKDKAKVKFATVLKNVSNLQEKMNASSATESDKDRKPNQEDLEHVYQILSADLPNLFVKSMDYRIYHSDVVFVNNIKGTTTKGLYNYVKQVAFLRSIGHLKFAFVKFQILKITMHTQDNTIRVRWRIIGVSGMKIFLSFWKFKPWKIRESLKDQLKENETWYDGFSTFYVGSDGLVHKHVADKMMPDEDLEETKQKPIPSKLASQLTFSNLH